MIEAIDVIKDQYEIDKKRLTQQLEQSEKRVLNLEQKLKDKLLEEGTCQYISYLEERLLETAELSKRHF